jgi:predicted transcriptional regulator
MSDYNEKDKRFDDALRELIAKGLVDLGHDGKDFAFRVTEKGYAVAVELEKQRPQENE